MFLSCSVFFGCLELVRRPVANMPRSDPAQVAGNRDEEADVKKEGATDPVDTAVAKMVRSGRTGGERDGIRKVNEYVLWCIRQGMWSEAQHHLERTLQTDSLAASLHNNLGIIYEQLGERENAAASYARASELNVDNEVYKMNLRLLEQGARFDPTETLASDAPDDALPNPHQDSTTEPSGPD